MQTALKLSVTGCTAVESQHIYDVKIHLCAPSCRKVAIHSRLVSVLQLVDADLFVNPAELESRCALVVGCSAVSRFCLVKPQGRNVLLLVQPMNYTTRHLTAVSLKTELLLVCCQTSPAKMLADMHSCAESKT